MEDHAAALGLSYKQLQRWFVQKRRKEKSIASRRTVDINSSSSKYKLASMVRKKMVKRKKIQNQLQDLFTPDYILSKVFRKDGPPLGVEFDSLPSGSFSQCKGILQILAIVFLY